MDPSPPAGRRRPAFWHVWLAPWLYLFAPARAATVMIAASSSAFWTMYLAHAAGAGAGVVFAVVWADTVESWTFYTPYATYPPVKFRSIGDIWDEWHVHGSFGRAEFIFLAILVALLVGSHFLAALNWPRIHRDGPAWPSFFRSHRVVASAAAAVCVRVVGGALLVSALDRASRMSSSGFREQDEWLPMLLAAMPLLLLRWIGLAVDAAPRRPLTTEPPPCCEGCGYDLTVLPAGERCPECGRPVLDSLTPGLRRTPSPWATRPSPGTWLDATLAIFVRPAAFYGGLAVRDDQGAANRFARWHLFIIAILASLWITTCMAIRSAGGWQSDDVRILGGLMLFGAPVGAWIIHRTVAAIAALVTLFARAMPDHAWLARAIAYETAFVWTICGYSGLLVTTFVGYDNWLTAQLGFGFLRVFGIPAEPLFFLAGNAAICALWLIRYRWIVAAIRWNNS